MILSTEKTLAASALLLATSPFTAAAKDYLPKAGQSSLSLGVSYTEFDRFYAGDVLQPGVPGGGEITRLSYRGYFFYGLQDGLALDFSIGYAQTDSNITDQSAFTDIYAGINYQFAKEDTAGLDALVRFGVIIAGDYDTGFLSAPGDGENGLDFSVKFGRSLGIDALRSESEIGYAIYEGPVPDSYRIKSGFAFDLGGGFSVDASAIYFNAPQGIDIGGPGFTGLGDLPAVGEEGIAGEFGIAVGTPYGYYRLGYTEVFDGENVGEERTVGLSGSWSF